MKNTFYDRIKIYQDCMEKEIQLKLGKKSSIDMIVSEMLLIYSAFLIRNMFSVTKEYVENQYIKIN